MRDGDRAKQDPASEAGAGNTERSAAFDPKDLLSRLWRQNLPLMRHRVESLETAAQQAAAGTLTQDLRTQASDIAHKLAGSLGMFGFPAGTDIAREMESMLEAEDLLDATRFVRLAAELRAVLAL